VTVGEWLLSQRLALAQQLLETTDEQIDQVAESSGLARRCRYASISIRHSKRRLPATDESFAGVKQVLELRNGRVSMYYYQ